MKNIVDLSLTIEDGMISYPSPSQAPFKSQVLGRIPVEGRETRKLSMGSHSATHVDAPKHFFSEDISIDEIPLYRLVGPAFLVDAGRPDPGTVIEAGTLDSKIRGISAERLVIKTGWSRFWNTDQYYRDWPCISRECAELLISKGIHLLAMDFPSPDPAYSGGDDEKDCPNHKLFFGNDVILVEYLTNLESLAPGWIQLMVMPLKLKGFDGAPARVAAYPLDLNQ